MRARGWAGASLPSRPRRAEQPARERQVRMSERVKIQASTSEPPPCSPSRPATRRRPASSCSRSGGASTIRSSPSRSAGPPRASSRSRRTLPRPARDDRRGGQPPHEGARLRARPSRRSARPARICAITRAAPARSPSPATAWAARFSFTTAVNGAAALAAGGSVLRPARRPRRLVEDRRASSRPTFAQHDDWATVAGAGEKIKAVASVPMELHRLRRAARLLLTSAAPRSTTPTPPSFALHRDRTLAFVREHTC